MVRYWIRYKTRNGWYVWSSYDMVDTVAMINALDTLGMSFTVEGE